MKSDFTEFSPVDKKKWVEKIISDLKGKREYGDLDYKIDENISLEAVQMSYQHPIEKPLNTNPAQWGIALDIQQEKNANISAHKYLETGLHSLCFKIDDTTAFDVLFHNILTEYVILHLDFSACSPSGFSRFNDWYAQNMVNSKHFLIIQSKTENQIAGQHLTIYSQINTEQYVCEQLSEMLRLFRNKTDFDYLKQAAVSVEVGKDFLKSVATIRAIRILWANFLKISGQDTSSPIFIVAQPSIALLSSDQNINLIELTYMQLSAYLGNADLIYGMPVKDAEDDEYARLSLNIHHIFSEESKLNKVLDPTAGSYFIENATNKIAEESWDKFILTT